MPEEIKLRMARAYPAQIQRVREWFQRLDELYHDENVTDADIAIFVHAHYGDVESEWERILFGYETLIDNACDQTKSYLEFKPEIRRAMSLASGAGELFRAAEELLKWRAKIMLIILPYREEMDGLEQALAHLSTAVHRYREGDPSKPESDAYSA